MSHLNMDSPDYLDHPAEENFSCPKCNLEFSDAIKLKNHKSTHLEERFIMINVKGVSKKIVFMKDENNRFACNFCSSEFGNFSNLRRHLKSRCKVLKGKDYGTSGSGIKAMRIRIECGRRHPYRAS